jgi:N,N'-diacetyllegionaminate synthase
MNFKKIKKTYIIAEIGVNHNGSLNLAKKLIYLAKKAGADAVKFQTFKAINLADKNTKKTIYQKKNTRNSKENHYEMLSKLELSNYDFVILKKFAKKNKIDFISTPYDIESAKFLNKLGLKILKVASADLVDVTLNKYLANTNCAIIISLGMASLDEIKRSLEIYGNKKNSKLCLLHCVSNYPCSDSSINLLFLKSLENMGYTYGFSDHSLSDLPSIMTVALGGKVIEKHFTINKNMRGPDHKSSLNFKEFKKFVLNLRKAEKILGKNIKFCQKEETNMKKVSRKSIFTKLDIKKNNKFLEKNIQFKRPGTGLIPLDYLNKIIGKKAKKDLKKNQMLKIRDVRW